MNKLEDARKTIRREVEAIYKRDGALSPTPHIAIEVIGRLKTMTSWEGRNTNERMGQSIRRIVEEAVAELKAPKLKSKPKQEKLEDYDDGDPADDVDWQDPTEAALYTKTYVVPAAKRNRLAKVI